VHKAVIAMRMLLIFLSAFYILALPVSCNYPQVTIDYNNKILEGIESAGK